MIKIFEEKYFTEWFNALTKKEQLQVTARLKRITDYGHFGDVKHIGEGLCELRWANGWRVYFIVIENSNIVLILGGRKNDQKKEIKKAKIFIKKCTQIQN